MSSLFTVTTYGIYPSINPKAVTIGIRKELGIFCGRNGRPFDDSPLPGLYVRRMFSARWRGEFEKGGTSEMSGVGWT